MFAKQFRNSLIWMGILGLAAVGEVREPLICRWSPRDPGSTVVSRNRVNFLSLASRSVTVEAMVEDTGREIRVDMRIENQSEGSIPIDPAAFVFEVESPKAKQLKFETAEKVAGRALAIASSMDPMGNGATFNRTAQSAGNGAAEHEAARILQTALRSGSLPPSQAISGAVYFEREKKKEETLLRVPVGKMIFEFPFTWSGGRVVDARISRVDAIAPGSGVRLGQS